MKKLKLAFSLAVFAFFVSCDSDETTPTPKILSNLSASLAKYESASDSQWVEISETEYNLLKENLTNVSIGGAVDTLFEKRETSSRGTSNFSRSNNNDNSIPSNSFVFAFKYYPTSDSQTSNNAQVKISEQSRTLAFSDLGNSLPSHTGGTTRYFIIKNGAYAKIGNNTGYLGIYNDIDLGLYRGGSYNFSSGNTSSITSPDNTFTNLIQCLSTTENPW